MILSDLWERLKCPLTVWEREGIVQKKIFEETIPENFQNLVCVLVAQSCPTLCDPTDCSPPGSFIHGIFQARIVEWVAISFSRRSSQPRDRALVSHISGRLFIIWATREAQGQSRMLVWWNRETEGVWINCWILALALDCRPINCLNEKNSSLFV